MRRQIGFAEAALVILDVGLGRWLQMAPGQRLEFVPACAAKCLDHGQVIASGAVERVRKRIRIGPDAINLLGKQIDCFDQAGIAAQPEQHLVKAQVTVKDGEQVTRVDRCGMPELYFLQSFDICGGDRERNDTNRHHLQLFPNGVDFPYLAGGQSAHQCTAIGNSPDQALLLEFEQRQSHVAAMGLELVTEILLDQPFARLTPSQDYVLFDALGDDGRGRFARA